MATTGGEGASFSSSSSAPLTEATMLSVLAQLQKTNPCSLFATTLNSFMLVQVCLTLVVHEAIMDNPNFIGNKIWISWILSLLDLAINWIITLYQPLIDNSFNCRI